MNTPTIHPSIRPDQTPAQPGARRRGSAIVAAVLFVLVAGIVTAWTIRATQNQMRATWQARIYENSLHASATQLRSMYQQAEYIIKTRPTQFNGQLTNIDPAVAGVRPPAIPGFAQVLSDRGNPLSFVRGIGANDLQFDTVNVAPGDADFETLKNWQGFNLARLTYDFYSVLAEDSPNAQRLGFTGAGYRKQISFLYIPLYQYAIFYDNNLELHPGPIMDIRGRVHTNKNLFLNSADRLTFWDKVTAVQSLNAYNDFVLRNVNATPTTTGNNALRWPHIFRVEMFNSFGSVNFPNANSNLSRNDIATGAWSSFSNQFTNMVVAAGDPRDSNANRALDSADTNFSALSAQIWGDQFKDGSRGVSNIRLPISPDALAQVSEANVNSVILNRVLPTDSPDVRRVKYESAADIKILGDPGDPSTIRITDNNGNTFPNVVTRSNGTTFSVWSIGEFFDARQNTIVKTIRVDMANLGERFGTRFNQGNGVLYVSTTPVPANGETWSNKETYLDWIRHGRNNYMPAVQIVNATRLPRNTDKAFTIATDRPLYQVGNFNNGALPSSPNTAVASEKVTAVMAADAISLTTQELTLELLDPVTGAVIQPGNTREGIPGAANADARTHKANPAATGNLTTNAILVMGDTPTKYKDPNVALPPLPAANATAQQKRDYISTIDNIIRTVRENTNWRRVQQPGGAHNVIRYMENHGGRTHFFNGSMLVLFESRYARHGHWHTGSTNLFSPEGIPNINFYNPPNRDYAWDSSFATGAPPRGMLFLIDVQTGSLERISPAEASAVRDNPGTGNTVY